MVEHALSSVLDSKAIIFSPEPEIVVMYHP